MSKEIKEKIRKLNKKAEKLTNAIFNEPKANMYNKNMELLISVNKQKEELRKKYEVK